MTVSARVLLLAMASVLAACGGKQEVEEVVRPVRSVVITGGTSAESATYTAEIRSRVETDLSFQVGGKVIRRDVDVGANVKRGQALAQLDQTDTQLGVDAARGGVRRRNRISIARAAKRRGFATCWNAA